MPEEMLDVLNEEDGVMGQLPRPIVHRRGLWHRGVHVFLFTRAGELLLQKRSADRIASPSLWDGSVSEHVKAGEGYLEAALRGMKEELGVAGTALYPLVKFKMNYGPNDNEISTLFEGMVDPRHVRFDPKEIQAIAYYDLEGLADRMKNHPREFCGWFVQILSWYLDQPSKAEPFGQGAVKRMFSSGRKRG